MKRIKLDMNTLNCVLLVVVLVLVIMYYMNKSNEDFSDPVKCNKDPQYNKPNFKWFTDFCDDIMKKINHDWENKCIDIEQKSTECLKKMTDTLDTNSSLFCTSNCVCTNEETTKLCKSKRQKDSVFSPSTSPFSPSTSPFSPSTSPFAPTTSSVYDIDYNDNADTTSPFAPTTSPFAPSTSPFAPTTSPFAPTTSPFAPSTTSFAP